MPNMKRWSDAKLEKEVFFARAAKDESHPENMAWIAALDTEANRRNAIDEGRIDGDYGPPSTRE